MINDTAARQFFANDEPVGKTLTFSGPVEVVGVIRAVRNFGPEVDPQPELYLALDQSADTSSEIGGDLVVRTAVAASTVAPIVRDAARAAVGQGDVFEPRFLEHAYARQNAGRRFNATVMSVFGGIALVIGAIGIYATFAFVVAQEVRAIGLRLALGATPAGVRRLILGDAMRRVGAGIAIGLAAAWADVDLVHLSGLRSGANESSDLPRRGHCRCGSRACCRAGAGAACVTAGPPDRAEERVMVSSNAMTLA